MNWPSWLWIGTPVKFWLWLMNRLMTWTGLFYFWKRFRSQRFFWAWFALINMASFSALGILFFWLYARSSR